MTDEIQISRGSLLIDGKECGAVRDVQFAWTPAPNEVPGESLKARFPTGPILVSGKVDMSALTQFDALFGLPPQGPPEFNITPGDAKPGQTIRARNLTTTPTDAGTDVAFTSAVRRLQMVGDTGTGVVAFSVVAEGGYEFPVSRETYIDLCVEEAKACQYPDPDEFRRELEERLPRGKK